MASVRFPSRVFRIVGGLVAVFCVDAVAAIPQSEHDALVAFFNSTGGNNWTDHTGWNGQSGTECTWFGVECDDSGSTVVSLLLANNGLSGTLPTLGGLSNLQQFYVQDNALHGTIPSLTALEGLRGFYVNGNQLTGPLPSLVGLSQLSEFDVSGNDLSGTIPPLTGLASLYVFNVESNQLTGSIPSPAGLATLNTFAVDANQLTGSIPALTDLPALQWFSAGYNQLSGSIPPLTGLAQLSYFYVAGNRLTGSIPSLVGLTSLGDFDVSNNQLSGPIPALNGLPQLQQVWLSGNQLTGTIPSLAGLNLSALGVDGNRLTGTLPPLGGMTNLQYFYAGSNQLTGPVPSLSGLVKLQNFDIDGNQLAGSAPVLSGLTELVYFSIARNQLTGGVPALSGLSKLEFFDVSFNQLTGSIPTLSGLANLQFVYLDFNQLSGSIPALAGLGKLQEFVVLDNQLTGSIPALSGLASLTAFNAESNRLSGALPALNGLTQLSYFSVTGNQIGGPLPQLSGLSNLNTFDVSFNAITGSIPALNQLPSLQYLYLDVNQLSGSIPSLGSLANLLVFDADENQLSGSIPALTSLTNLQEFNVYSNRLSGNLPALTGLANLQAFEVGDNRLSGAIPAVPASNSLVAGLSSLCPNLLTHTPNSAWDDATGLSPWFSTCADTESTNGAPTTKDSTQIVLSHDGKLKVFQSQQTDLTSDKANTGGQDIYSVSANGAPVLESVDAAGHKLIGATSAPAISPDGKVVAFLYAPGAGAALTADTSTLQLYAGAQGAPKHRVDNGSGGAAPNAPVSSAPSVASANGTYQIAFCSAASNIVAGDSNGQRDIFLADAMSAAAPIQRLSVDAGGQQISGDSCEPKLSKDGTKLAFSLSASGLYGTPARQIVVKDLGSAGAPTGVLKLVTPATGTTHGANGDSSEPVISDDGSVVAFTSAASNLDGMGAPIGGHEVFVALSPAGTPRIQRARSGDGSVPNGASQHPQLSGDGTVVVMQTDATNFLTAQSSPDSKIAAKTDATTAPPQCGAVAITTNYSSVTGMGAPLCNGTTQNQAPSISGDGSTGGFDSNAPEGDGSDNRNAYAQGLGTYTGLSGLTIPNLSGDYSGQWLDPSQSGHGLVLDVTEPDANNQRLLVMTWFVYLNGQSTWVQGVGMPRAGSGTAANTVIVQMDEVDIFRGAGFPLGATQASPSRWGSATLTFTDANTGTLSWRSTQPGFGFGSMPIKHFLAVGLPMQDAQGAKVKACYSGNWFNPAQNGHGFELEVLPGANPLLVVDWFAYAPGGAPVWLQGVGSISGNTAQVPLQIYDGPGAQFPPNFDPSAVTPHDWGTATFTFTDSTHAQVNWNSTIAGYGAGTQPLQPILRIDRRDCN